MATFPLSLIFRLLLVLSSLMILECQVEEVHSENFNKVTSKLFSVLYLYPKGCFRCRELYPKFIQAYQTFQYDREIYFCKVKSRKLIRTMNVTSFPSILYFQAGDKKPDRYRGDVTVDDLFGLVQHTIHGDFSDVKRHYVVDLTMGNFRTVVYIPTQYTMILVYYEEDEDVLQLFESVGEAFKKEEKIVFCKINVDISDGLSSHFSAPEYPAVYWYPKGKIKNKKRYGGSLGVEELIDFVNDKAGFERKKGGELTDNAGRIESLDRIVQRYVDELTNGVDLKSFLEDAQAAAAMVKDRQRYADYYLYLMEEIVESGSVSIIHDSRSEIIWKLSHDDLSTLQKEDLIRKRNILDHFNEEISILNSNAHFKMMEKFKKKSQKQKKEKNTKRKRAKSLKKKKHLHEEL